MNLKDIEQIIAILKQNDVLEFEIEQDGTRIRLTRAGAGMYRVEHGQSHNITAPQPAIIASSGQTQAQTQAGADSLPGSENFFKVDSPLVGTFYRKPSPDAEPFVKEGDIVKKGATLCIVEAMKLMNEIESPVGGRIEKVLIPDGQVVEYGEVLFLLNPAL